jgi:hypothetical protein
MGAKICIAIAVHAPEILEPLPGALNAAKSVIDWASALGIGPAYHRQNGAGHLRSRAKVRSSSPAPRHGFSPPPPYAPQLRR